MWGSLFDPRAVCGHPGEGLAGVLNEFTFGFNLLAATAVGSFFYGRFFCRHLCSMEAFPGLLSKQSLTRITRDKNLCIDCNLRSNVCAMNIPVARELSLNVPGFSFHEARELLSP